MAHCLNRTLAFAILTLFFLSQPTWADSVGRVVSVEGDAFLVAKEANAPNVPLTVGLEVHPHDIINTLENAKVKLMLHDKTILDLSPKSLFQIAKYEQRKDGARDADLTLFYGTARAAVTRKLSSGSKYSIRTPSATMGVRGTELVVSSNIQNVKTAAEFHPAAQNPEKTMSQFQAGATSEVTVVQGLVDVTNLGAAPAVQLKGGDQVTVTPGANSLNPRTLSTSELASISASARFADHTFLKAVSFEAAKGRQSGTSGTDSRAELALFKIRTAEDRTPSSSGAGSGSGNAGSASPHATALEPPGSIPIASAIAPRPGLLPPGGGAGAKSLSVVITK